VIRRPRSCAAPSGTLTEEVRSLVEKRVREVVAGVAQMTGAENRPRL
jgi:hypothetical protein